MSLANETDVNVNSKFVIKSINNNRIARKRFDLVCGHPQCVVGVVTI